VIDTRISEGDVLELPELATTGQAGEDKVDVVAHGSGLPASRQRRNLIL
jgi:hypothetical protein